MKKAKLQVRNLAQIREGIVEFGDFTLLVGPQASGKSIFLQMLKLLIDKDNIFDVLKSNAYDWEGEQGKFCGFYFGEGYGNILNRETIITFESKEYTGDSFLNTLYQKERFKLGKPKPKKYDKVFNSPGVMQQNLFYVPAQRIVSMVDGWPNAFNSFYTGDPYVLKAFGETIRLLMERESAIKKGKLLTANKRLNIRAKAGILYGANLEIDSTNRKRFLLNYGKGKLPYMNWSSGQKEFIPLLLSFNYLSPINEDKRAEIKWAIIEEPEMGLHPEGIQQVMIIMLELLSRGYKLVVSTHSPVLLELLWAIRYIKENNGTGKDLSELFNTTRDSALLKVFDEVIKKEFKTYYFHRTKNEVEIKDISSLDAGNNDPDIANWGGISSFGSKAVDIVSKLVAANEK